MHAISKPSSARRSNPPVSLHEIRPESTDAFKATSRTPHTTAQAEPTSRGFITALLSRSSHERQTRTTESIVSPFAHATHISGIQLGTLSRSFPRYHDCLRSLRNQSTGGRKKPRPALLPAAEHSEEERRLSSRVDPTSASTTRCGRCGEAPRRARRADGRRNRRRRASRSGSRGRT